MSILPMSRRKIGRTVADAFVRSEWLAGPMATRAAADLGIAIPDWLESLAAAAVDHFRVPPLEQPFLLDNWVLTNITFTFGVMGMQPVWVSAESEDEDDDDDDDDDDDEQGGGDWKEPQSQLSGHSFFMYVPATSTSHSGRQLTPAITRFGPMISHADFTTLPLPLLGHRPEPPPVDLRWPVIPLPWEDSLADLFGITVGELQWWADTRSYERRVGRSQLRHYRYAWIPKPNGTTRLLEVPKSRLMHMQRRILREILDAVPPHHAATAFRPGRSVHDGAAAHVGRSIVLHVDLEDFFGSIDTGRVVGLFRTIGYERAIAQQLCGLTTNTVASSELLSQWLAAPPEQRAKVRRSHQRLRQPHLPQGSPTSPAIANLVAYRLDCRLTGLAQQFGATYTRYADDIVFSGDDELVRGQQRCLELIGTIVRDEGFRLNDAKTSVRRASNRQYVTGLVVNERINVPREEFDRLRAILHDAIHHGPAAANRDNVDNFAAHLLGKIAWVGTANPTRGDKLRAMFHQITWPNS
jgi:RNA-directed DNA polymerase